MPKHWTATIGQKPVTVVLYEKQQGGVIYARVWDPRAQKPAVRSLAHRDRARALAWAAEQVAMLADAKAAAKGAGTLAAPAVGTARKAAMLVGMPTVRGVMALYRAHRLPQKQRAQRQEDRRRLTMWTRLYGDRMVQTLGAREWDEFIRERRAGVIRADGTRVPAGETPQPVGARTVDADLVLALSVFNWACQFPRDDHSGLPVLDRNPWAGAGKGIKRVLVRPKNRAVRRPVASTARYEAALAVAGAVTCRLPAIRETGRGAGRRTATEQPSYLDALLRLAYHTGRRITALCSLTRDRVWRDAAGVTWVRWPALKEEDEHVVELRADVAAVLWAHLARIAALARLIGWRMPETAPVFPQPRALCRFVAGQEAPVKALTRWTARDWLEAADARAENPPLGGGCWHPYRRSFATRKKHLPAADVMAVAGWKDGATMRAAYQHADPVTTRRVIEDDTRLD